MTCEFCEDHGVVPVLYYDEPESPETCAYAVCLCVTGRRLRPRRGSTWPPWKVWAAQRGVPFDRLMMLEDAYTWDELRPLGFTPSMETGTDDVTAAGRLRTERRR